MTDVKPMMKQYYEIKSRTEGCILFFRLGDFYEMFDEDAKLVSAELDLALTTRDRGKDESERVPMCGVPYHSAENYIARLISKGYRVAICEQTEDPKLAKGLVTRDIVRIITPGTVIEDSMLEKGRNNYICSVYIKDGGWAACFADISTGEAYLTGGEAESARRLEEELARFSPREALLGGEAASDEGLRRLLEARLNCRCVTGDDGRFDAAPAGVRVTAQFKNISDTSELTERGVSACGALISYLYETQKTDLSHMNRLSVYSEGQFMSLDITARRNLELVETLRTKEKKGSLLWVLDRTRTPMGGRLIRSWIEKPLLSPAAIGRRLNAVGELRDGEIMRKELLRVLEKIGDMERLIARTVYGTSNGRDLVNLANAIGYIPHVKKLLGSPQSARLTEILDNLDELADVREQIESTISDDPPFSVREGGLIRPGFDSETDRLRDIMSGAKETIAAIENRERERTGIKKLKIGYNRVFGYYIEIPRSSGQEIPGDYVRKQTLTSGERYINDELKQMESAILTAEDRLKALEYELFTKLREYVASQVARVQSTAAAIAELDVYCAFAQTAADEGYTRPEVDYSGVIEIKDGRHPVVEKVLSGSLFVPNDTSMNNTSELVQIITGPNMAGKSTYMRQVALIVLMAQIGSYVPASRARIGVVDRIFTRIGASDDLAGGQSTFMVEMSEVAEMLSNATSRSLLILDEIGRGTSTFDGMAIARAVVEYVASGKLGARTLFATHYHELTELEDKLERVKNYNIAAKKRGDDIIFLRKIVRGGADDSYGIEVAKLAGLPDCVVERSKEILASLESGKEVRSSGRKSSRSRVDPGQITLVDQGAAKIAQRLGSLDINTLTPLEALNILYEMKREL